MADTQCCPAEPESLSSVVSCVLQCPEHGSFHLMNEAERESCEWGCPALLLFTSFLTCPDHVSNNKHNSSHSDFFLSFIFLCALPPTFSILFILSIPSITSLPSD